MNRHHLALPAFCLVALMGGGLASSTRAQVTGLTINSITNDPAGPVTAGQTLEYIFRMSVKNNSALLAATISLNKTSTNVSFNGVFDPPGWQYTIDPALEGGGTSIPANGTRNVIFHVTLTGTTTGVITLGGKVGGSVGNGTTANGGSITVQSPPSLSYVDNSLHPLTAIRGQTVGFAINVSNPAGAATAEVIPSTTISFSSFSATLDGQVSVPGGATRSLSFTPTEVSPSIPLGPHPLAVNLNYTHNGNSGSASFPDLGNDQVTVQLNTGNASIQITSMTADVSTATANQTTPYTIQMRVLNGPVPVRVSLDPDSTNLVLPGGGWQYVLESIQGGDNRLNADEQADVVFRVTRTGSTTGVIQIDGNVGASAGSTHVTDTIDNGESITVQSQPALAYVDNSLHPQVVHHDESVGFTINVSNPPGAATAILSPPTAISFSTYNAELTNQISVPGGQTRTLTFDPTDVNPSIPLDSYPVSVNLVYTHNDNDGSATFANLGNDEVTVQLDTGEATIQIASITPAESHVTANQTTPYTIRMRVVNGPIPVRVSLDPDSTNLVLPGGGWQYVLDSIQGGDNRLNANEQADVTFRVTRTGSTTGVIQIGGKVGASAGSTRVTHTINNGGPITVQSPPSLAYAVGSLFPMTVTQGESVGFAIDVTNPAGAATALLTQSQTTFSFPGFTATLNSPVSVPGGQRVTLAFTPRAVSVALGEYAVAVNLDYTHNGNNGSAAFPNLGNDKVTVQEPTGGPSIQILSITPEYLTATENQTTPYTVRMTVLNGPVPVHVSLDSDSTNLIFPGSGWQFQIQSVTGGTRLDDGEQADVVFNVTRTGSTTGVIPIDGKVGASAGSTRVTHTIDNGGTIQVQSQPSLQYVGDSLAPQPVTHGQQVSFQIKVRNTGGATAKLIPGQTSISFAGSAYTATLNGASQTDLAGGGVETSLLFNQRVVDESIPPDSYPVAVVLNYTHNRNSAAPVNFNANNVTVEMGGGGSQFHIESTVSNALNQREGVSYVNTNQTFQITVVVQNDGPALEDVLVSLHASPSAFIFAPDDSVQNIGTETSASYVFTVRAPVTSFQDIQRFTASIDAATYAGGGEVEAAPPIDNTELAFVQDPTSLDLSFEITSPQSARDGTMSVGQVFEVTARVTKNLRGAEIDPSSRAEVTLALPGGAEFQLEENPTRSFTLGAPITWSVTAPNAPVLDAELEANISAIPNDINTRTAARVETGFVEVIVNVISASLGLADASAVQGIVGRSVPGGTKDIDAYALDLTYLAGEGEEFDAQIDTIFVTVLGRDGRRISNPGRTLGRVYAWLNGAAATAPGLSANPIMIPMEGLGPAAMINPNETATLILGVDVLSNPASSEIRLSITRARDLVAHNVSSPQGQVLGIIDRLTENPIDGRFRSPPLTILSSQFEEYAHNFPNPFRAGVGETRIAYFLDANADVSIDIYAITGDLVYERSLRAGSDGATSGPQAVEWDGRNMDGDIVRNGIYVCVVQAGSKQAKIRIAVAR